MTYIMFFKCVLQLKYFVYEKAGRCGYTYLVPGTQM